MVNCISGLKISHNSINADLIISSVLPAFEKSQHVFINGSATGRVVFNSGCILGTLWRASLRRAKDASQMWIEVKRS